jgi:hypothetical protein
VRFRATDIALPSSCGLVAVYVVEFVLHFAAFAACRGSTVAMQDQAERIVYDADAELCSRTHRMSVCRRPPLGDTVGATASIVG